MKQEKYLAVKVAGIPHWLWFKTDNVQEDATQFRATGGWGKGGAYTDLTCDASLIKGRIKSDAAQYS